MVPSTTTRETRKMTDTNTRYETANDWIRVSLPNVTDEYVNAIASVCKCRKGIWTVLKNPPKDTRRALIWHAFKIGIHLIKWGNYAPWTDRVTYKLMRADDSDRELFDYVLETTVSEGTTVVAKKRALKQKRNN